MRSFELWLKNVHNKVRVVFNCWLIYFKKARKAILLDNVCSAGLTKLLKKRADFEFIAGVLENFGRSELCLKFWKRITLLVFIEYRKKYIPGYFLFFVLHFINYMHLQNKSEKTLLIKT